LTQRLLPLFRPSCPLAVPRTQHTPVRPPASLRRGGWPTAPSRPPSARRAPPASVHGTMPLRPVTACFLFSHSTLGMLTAAKYARPGRVQGCSPAERHSRAVVWAAAGAPARPPARPRSSPCACDHAAAAYRARLASGARAPLVVRAARAWLGRGGHAPSGRAPPCPRCRTDRGRGVRE
jgi:hypothetical protein